MARGCGGNFQPEGDPRSYEWSPVGEGGSKRESGVIRSQVAFAIFFTERTLDSPRSRARLRFPAASFPASTESELRDPLSLAVGGAMFP